MTNFHDLTKRGYKKLQMFRRSYLEIQHWPELWFLHLVNLYPRHNKQLSLNAFWLTVWTECFCLLFFSFPRLPRESGVTSHIFGLLSPPRMIIPPSWIVPSWINVGEHHYPLGWWTGTCTPPNPLLGRVLFLSPLLVLYVVVAQLAVPKLLCGHTVSKLTLRWPVTACLMGQYSTYHLTLGWVIECWMLAGMLIAGYWKCHATTGPTLGTNFCHGYVSLSYTGPTELKTPTLSAVIYILIYLLPLTYRLGDTRRHSLVTDTLTNGRKRCKHRTQWERRSLEKGLCTNENN